jgi:hypothetical protein
LELMKIWLSLLQSSAREVETLDCHQIVTKTGAKQAKTSKLQEIESGAI